MSLSRVEKLEKIVQLNSLLNRSDDFKYILSVILTETEKIFNVQGASILLEDEDTGILSFYAVSGDKEDILKTIQMEHGEGVCGHVLETGEALIENAPQDSQFFSNKADQATDFQTHNILAVPLSTDNRNIGVLELVNKIGGDFTDDDLEFLEFVATQISITLARAKAIAEIIKSERLASIGETVAGLSHCIRNILQGMKSGAIFIDKYIHEVDQDRIKSGWELIRPNIDRISDLAMNMLEYSKQRDPNFHETDLNKLVEEVVELAQQTTESAEAFIDCQLQSDLETIELDQDRIFRALLNLVKNALEATEEMGDGRVSVSTRKSEPGWVEIKISDNGCGIENEYQQKLFTKFFSTKGQGGTGLGLPTTKKIISEHNGDITVESEVNKGSTFTIVLPTNRN
jgi:two-component system, NtrC family, sensor kinase